MAIRVFTLVVFKPECLIWMKQVTGHLSFCTLSCFVPDTLIVLAGQKTSKCMSRSCWLKDPVTTAAVCSTGHMAWDYAVFVGHRGFHRWLWVTWSICSDLWSGYLFAVITPYSGSRLTECPFICVDVLFLKLPKTCVIAQQCLMPGIKHSKHGCQAENIVWLSETNKCVMNVSFWC